MAITFRQDLETTDKLIQDNNLLERLPLQTQAAKEFVRIALANALLMDRKQLDYGPKNISGFGTFGALVRMNDKFERLKTLFGTGKRKAAKNESIHDSLRDISNYAIIALLIELDRWPNE